MTTEQENSNELKKLANTYNLKIVTETEHYLYAQPINDVRHLHVIDMAELFYPFGYVLAAASSKGELILRRMEQCACK